MRYVSTRGSAPPLPASEALVQGLAPDGGLYVPESFPQLGLEALDGVEAFAELAARALEPFFAGDALERALPELCREAFDFPIPLKALARATAVLELFHGPTAAFKDFGARFLAGALARLRGDRALTVLVATSGDTGGAVAAAFWNRPGIRVVVLFPKGQVSPRQEKQLTCWGGNIVSLAVRGTFDDCQRMVKEAFGRSGLRARFGLTSANSINLGRLLPQAAYYAAASLWYERRTGHAPGFIVPSGNIGNAAGALWAKRMGFPVRHVKMATNANRVVPEYFATGRLVPRPSLRTLANAMDVGNPSNMERVSNLYPTVEALRADASALSVSDEEIRRAIAEGPARWGEVWCPHTATAAVARERESSPHWVLVGTAHPAKFSEIVEPLIGREVQVPPALEALLARDSRFEEIDATLEELERKMAAAIG